MGYMKSLWSGWLHRDVHILHQIYGDIVRIAPDELSFARTDAWGDIYSNRGSAPAFPKSKVWHDKQPGRPMSVLNAIDPKTHARYRRAIDPGFTERAVLMQESIVQEYVEKFEGFELTTALCQLRYLQVALNPILSCRVRRLLFLRREVVLCTNGALFCIFIFSCCCRCYNKCPGLASLHARRTLAEGRGRRKVEERSSQRSRLWT